MPLQIREIEKNPSEGTQIIEIYHARDLNLDPIILDISRISVIS